MEGPKKLCVPEVMVGLIKSFHQDMKVRRICLDWKLMGSVTVANGSRQGCCRHLYFSTSTLVQLWRSGWRRHMRLKRGLESECYVSMMGTKIFQEGQSGI